MIATNGKKACVIMDGDKVVTKILVLQPVYELEGDMLLKFAVDVKKGTTLFVIDGSTEVAANDDYKAGDYLYFSKGTFHPTKITYGVSNGTLAYEWYSEIRYLKGLDVSMWSDMSYAIGGWAYVGRPSAPLKIVDMTHLNTSNVTEMEEMFCNCQSLTSLDVSGWDTSKVTTMSYMFYVCKSLTSLDVSGWDTSKVTTMSYMFCNCKSLTSLDVSGWDTSKVTTMSNMFYGCTSLTNLLFGAKWGTQTSTGANALTLNLSSCGNSKSYQLTDATYTSMLTMYDRATAGLENMTIQLSKKHNIPDGWTDEMTARGYTITLV